MAVRVPDRMDRGAQRAVGVVGAVDEAADRPSHGQVEVVTLGIERIGGGCPAPWSSRRSEARARRRVDRPPSAPGPASVGRGPVGSALLGGGKEALQISQSVSPVAPRVDPVVAQASGVAPGPDRVRMHAEETGGLGYRQGRVRGPGRDVAGHELIEEM